MTSAKLGDVAEFIRGITFKPEDVAPVGDAGVVGCMRTKNVQQSLDLSDVWGVPRLLVKRDDQLLRDGDILVSSANSWNLIGKCCAVPPLPWQATFGGFVSVLRGHHNKVDSRYLYRWFSSPRIQATVRGFGQQTTNIANLDIERCAGLTIPLPALAEQRRIADILDRADAMRAKRREAIALCGGLTETMYTSTCGDPISNPRGFPVIPLGELCDVRDGTHDSPAYVDHGGFPLLTSRNLSGGCIDLQDAPRISASDYEEINRRSKVDRGDIVMPMIGTIGNPVIVNCEPSFAIKNVALVKCRLDTLLPVVAKRLLSGEYFRVVSGRRSRGGSQQFISLGDLRSYPIPLPPLQEQRAFEEAAAKVDQLSVQEQRSLTELDALFASLQHRAFRGELWR